MVRVPLPFRGVVVLLLAASTVLGQTREPPAEFPPLDSVSPNAPDFLRQFSADPRHPLLSLMVDGELTSFEPIQAQDSSKNKPEPKSSSAAPKAAAPSNGTVLDGSKGAGVLDDGYGLGGVMGGGCGMGQRSV